MSLIHFHDEHPFFYLKRTTIYEIRQEPVGVPLLHLTAYTQCLISSSNTHFDRSKCSSGCCCSGTRRSKTLRHLVRVPNDHFKSKHCADYPSLFPRHACPARGPKANKGRTSSIEIMLYPLKKKNKETMLKVSKLKHWRERERDFSLKNHATSLCLDVTEKQHTRRPNQFCHFQQNKRGVAGNAFD